MTAIRYTPFDGSRETRLISIKQWALIKRLCGELGLDPSPYKVISVEEAAAVIKELEAK